MGEPITKPRLEDAVESAVRNLPNNALPSDVAKRVVTDPAIAPALNPIAWWKSQAILGNITAALGALLIVAPDLAPVLIPDHADTVVKWVGAITAFIGAYNGIKGRVTTTRPIG